jgi:hypothetical protein
MGRSQKPTSGMERRSSTGRTPLPEGLARPARRALTNAGLDHLEQLSTVPEAEVRELHGIGPNAVQKLRDALATLGLSFAESSPADGTEAPGNFADLWCDDRQRQGAAFQQILDETSQPVPWAYDVWDELLKQLSDRNNRNRSIAAQVMCNLAKSDPADRILRDFPALFDVVSDERFVTARHALQAMWKVGCVGEKHREILVSALESRFSDCVTHKNCTLIRHDIIESLRKLFDAVQDETIRTRAKALIELESDPKYKKKYSTLWPKK